MKLFLKTKDYAVTGEEFQLVHDKDLEMLVTRPQPLELESYYNSDDYISHTDSRRSFTEKLYHYFKKYSLKRKLALINTYAHNYKTLLDIGAGTGDFLSIAKKGGWDVKGVEPNRMARGRASEKGLRLKEEIDAFSNKKFQAITLWHVLEHLPELEIQIDKIKELLEQEGTLFVAVPNFRSYDANYYQNFWAAYDVPRHLWHFSSRAISELFARYGMKVIKIKPMIFDAFYVSLLSEKYKTGKTNYLKAFYRGLRSNIHAWNTGEYSSLLYILKNE